MRVLTVIDLSRISNLIVSPACNSIKTIIFKWIFTIFTGALPWALNNRGNNF